MAGYDGWSMSNNAVAAYENGEKPLSKWTKSDIILAIKKEINAGDLTLNCSFEKLKKVPAKVLREKCLYRSSWHHTGKHYRCTDFYSLDTTVIEELTDEILDEEIAASKIKQDVEPETEEKWICTFLVWSGTRKHPKATEVTEEGVVKGDWFYRANGRKKNIHARGFRFVKQLS